MTVDLSTTNPKAQAPAAPNVNIEDAVKVLDEARRLCEQNRLHAAVEILEKKLRFGATSRLLGLLEENLRTLGLFFRKDRTLVSGLGSEGIVSGLGVSEAQEIGLRQEYAFALWGTGRLDEAHRVHNTWFRSARHSHDATAASLACVNIAYLRLVTGSRSAAAAARRGIVIARGRDARGLAIAQTTLAYVLAIAGKSAKATAKFSAGMAIQHDTNLDERNEYMHFFLNEFYLMLGDFEAVRARVQRYRAAGDTTGQVLDMGLEELALGRALVAATEPAEAMEHLNKAVECLEASKQHDEVPRALLARAHAHIRLDRLEAAKADLDSADETIVSWGLELARTDWLLACAAHAMAEGKPDESQEYSTKAEEIAAKIGYLAWRGSGQPATAQLLHSQILRRADPWLKGQAAATVLPDTSSHSDMSPPNLFIGDAPAPPSIVDFEQARIGEDVPEPQANQPGGGRLTNDAEIRELPKVTPTRSSTDRNQQDDPLQHIRLPRVKTRVLLRSPKALKEIRCRMHLAYEQSKLSLAEIGLRMGIAAERQPHAVVWNLLNRSPNPDIFLILRFCRALKIPYDQVIPRDLDPMR